MHREAKEQREREKVQNEMERPLSSIAQQLGVTFKSHVAWFVTCLISATVTFALSFFLLCVQYMLPPRERERNKSEMKKIDFYIHCYLVTCAE